MEVFFAANKITDDRPVVLTLGNFDGFHVGHQEIVRRTVNYGKKNGLVSLLITLHPHPRQLRWKQIQPGRGSNELGGDLSMITPLEDKLELLSATSLDRVLVLPFTKAFASTTAESFIRDVLVGQLKARHIVVGYDWSFGRNARGNPRMIEQIGKELGTSSEVVSAVKIEDEVASSTAIRQAIDLGDMARAERIMDRRYTIKGRMQQGESGHSDELSMLSLVFPDQVILPPPAAYLVQVKAEGMPGWAVAVFPENQLGDRPGCLVVFPNSIPVFNRRWIKLEFTHISDPLADGPPENLQDLEVYLKQARALLSRHNVLE